MSEKEKMLSGQEYMNFDADLLKERNECTSLLNHYNEMNSQDNEECDKLIKKIIKVNGELLIEQPFTCMYGSNIEVGINFYAKKGLFVEDSAKVTIGDQVSIGANVTILTTIAPYNEMQRSKGYEKALPVFIHDHVYIGSSTTVCPNVRINQGAYIIPGSVVTNDIPPYVIAGGNPCQVIRPITTSDVRKDNL